MNLQEIHQSQGAKLASDGIPLHYGDLLKEYQAALHKAILLDRSHEGRVQLFGKSRYELLNRMTSNNMLNMAENEGRATIFTNPNARILDRIVVYNRGDHLLLIAEPGRGEWLSDFLQRNIFFGDDVRVVDITTMSKMFAIHGSQADAVLEGLGIDTQAISALYGAEIKIGDATIYAARRKVISGHHWALTCHADHAVTVYETVLEAGQNYGLVPAGSLTYNTLRIRAGRPARPELNTDYIPLEVGLWDEVHFAKGCYTGQEIIARMESRAQLAKIMVALNLSQMVQAPAEVYYEGRSIGKLTSSVQAPTGEIFAMAIIKTDLIEADTELSVGSEKIAASISGLLGKQPDYIQSRK
jgi:folate-binding protein YgfZ